MNEAMPKVEKGIPIPAKKASYPFGVMEVGDSFFTTQVTRVRSASAMYSARNGVEFVSRAEGDGVRVWRTK